MERFPLQLGVVLFYLKSYDDERYVGPHDLHDVINLPVEDDAAPKVRVVSEAPEDVHIKLGDGGEKDTGRNDPRDNEADVWRNGQSGNIKMRAKTRVISLVYLVKCRISGIDLSTLVA